MKYKRKLKTGDVVFANLGEGEGSELKGIYPCLVVSNNIGNTYSEIATIIPMVGRKKNKKKIPTQFIISNYEKVGLNKESVLLFEQIRTISNKRIIRKVGHFPPQEFAQFKKNILNVFGF